MIAAQEQDRLERSTETLCAPVSELPPRERREACLVHIYPTGPGMGRRFALADAPLLIGRSSDCAIHIEDNAVSRRHARIEQDGPGHAVVDLESTNGTFVNGVLVQRRALKDGDYVRAGTCIYRYLAGGNVEAEYHEEIYRLTIIDALTGIPNKRYLLEFLQRELARSARHHRPLALLLFDLDRFKSINDGRGHLCGDYVLSALAECVRPVVRAEELFARYGGEEFAVVLPECAAAEAAQVAERLRELIEQHPFEFQSEAFRVTISVGVAVAQGDEAPPAADLIQHADTKLYEAKNGGRNRVAV
jgi:two-component system cell cycle response regulator